MSDRTDAFASTEIECAEGNLRVYHAGERGSPVLLLSGAGVDNAMLSWSRLIPDLARNHRVFALDWPKQGKSRPWNGVADHPRMLRCITEVLDHFDLAEVSLVGMSQGGALTLAYAIEHPERVSSLVALSPGGIISFPPVVHQLLWLIAKVPFIGTGMMTRIFRHRSACAYLAKHGLFAGPVDDFEEVVDQIQQEVLTGGGGSSDWQNASIGFWRMNVDLRPRLPEIVCPALFIQGDKDVGVRPKHTIRAAKLVPNARLEILPGNGHWSNRQSPHLVNPLVADFLAADPASRG
ncbi:alpha/beta fold hydrolase [Actinoalloteichus hymeniacidonis]|uniref:Hydrolase or acyltransferase of alpha/beta superfamily n=1 Tax=Actinoalloteichus hymeniacidonis TaxID=340345 RepID=A0AAC9HSR7_9PSEU|nr:alpha/beta hydrolase [Actinoalloteichus hymeniacidonis]AOS64992.1 putative hydrolase or acyltransferase of alpha/beta superfamily [Actinoalloteichus hymeniacidonis]MBB5906932.1 pimeloyl-ACP methyl ester carboxylesterase [Actinoalloteichus hymeniacidonis]